MQLVGRAKIQTQGVKQRGRLAPDHYSILSLNYYYFLNILFFLFLERRRKGEREGEKHQCVVASRTHPTGHLACHPSMCPRLGIQLATL